MAETFTAISTAHSDEPRTQLKKLMLALIARLGDTEIAAVLATALDTDTALTANSDTKIATQKATKAYADAKVGDALVNGVTTVAPSQNAVFDALALKQDAASAQPLDAQLTSLAGLSYAGNALKVIRVNAGETGFELAVDAT